MNYTPQWVVKQYIGGEIKTHMFPEYEQAMARVLMLNREKRSDMVTLTSVKSERRG